MYYVQIICKILCCDFLKCEIITEYLSFSPRNCFEILRRKREGGYERRCKGTANSRVWSFLQIRYSVVGGCRIFWDSLSTIRKSKKEKPEKSCKLEINAKSSRYFFYFVFLRRLYAASDERINKDSERQR